MFFPSSVELELSGPEKSIQALQTTYPTERIQVIFWKWKDMDELIPFLGDGLDGAISQDPSFIQRAQSILEQVLQVALRFILMPCDCKTELYSNINLIYYETAQSFITDPLLSLKPQ